MIKLLKLCCAGILLDFVKVKTHALAILGGLTESKLYDKY